MNWLYYDMFFFSSISICSSPLDLGDLDVSMAIRLRNYFLSWRCHGSWLNIGANIQANAMGYANCGKNCFYVVVCEHVYDPKCARNMYKKGCTPCIISVWTKYIELQQRSNVVDGLDVYCVFIVIYGCDILRWLVEIDEIISGNI